jgi:hypothetical protein
LYEEVGKFQSIWASLDTQYQFFFEIRLVVSEMGHSDMSPYQVFIMCSSCIEHFIIVTDVDTWCLGTANL